MRTMKKYHIISVLICLIISMNTAFSQSNPSYAVRTVVIDAGHGGKDPGAVGKISQEKNITLAIALKTGSLIAANCPDVKVIYTRKTDEFIELHRRADIANKAKADLFISIHVNANQNKEATGTDTWTMGLAKNDANLKVAKMENDVISLEADASQYKGMSANDNEAIILHKLQQGVFCDNSLTFASMVQSQFKNEVGRKDRSVHQAPFLVLWKTAMPSVLIETGFITNDEEEKWLNQTDNQAEMAYAIYQAFLEYKKYIESRSKGGYQQSQPTTTQPETKPAPVAKPEVKKDFPQSNQWGIYYGIQIGAGKELNKLTPENFNGLKDVYYVEENGIYKYYYGKTASFMEIKEYLPEVKEKYPSAFIVARDKDNKKLQIAEARQKTK